MNPNKKRYVPGEHFKSVLKLDLLTIPILIPAFVILRTPEMKVPVHMFFEMIKNFSLTPYLAGLFILPLGLNHFIASIDGIIWLITKMSDKIEGESL